MINGVLVERTVEDVRPALQTNAEGLKKVLDDLVKTYKSKQDELDKWKVRHQARDEDLLSFTRWGPRCYPTLILDQSTDSTYVFRRSITFKLSSSRTETHVSSHSCG